MDIWSHAFNTKNIYKLRTFYYTRKQVNSLKEADKKQRKCEWKRKNIIHELPLRLLTPCQYFYELDTPNKFL